MPTSQEVIPLGGSVSLGCPTGIEVMVMSEAINVLCDGLLSEARFRAILMIAGYDRCPRLTSSRAGPARSIIRGRASAH